MIKEREKRIAEKRLTPLDLIGAGTFAKMLGTSQQSVSEAGKRSLSPKYRGDMLRPDAVFEGRPLWIREKAESYSKNKNGGGKDGS